MQHNEDKKFWFDYTYKKILAANRFVNMILGARGCGKTFAFKDDAVQRFLNHGEQFIYMRRYEKELLDQKARKLFFPEDLKRKYPEHELVFRNGVYMIDGKVGGFPMALSVSGELKSIEYDLVTRICFDEFIRIEGTGYLKDETTLFNEALITCSRMRDPRWFLMSNNVSWQNPYFIRYKIPRPPADKETIYGKTWSLSLPRSEKYKQAMVDSPVGQFLLECDPDHFEYAFGNATFTDNDDFIGEQPKGARYIFTLKIFESFGVWVTDTGFYYIGRKTDPSAHFVFDLHPEELRKGARIRSRKGGIFDRFVKAFCCDKIIYEDVDVKNNIRDIMRSII